MEDKKNKKEEKKEDDGLKQKLEEAEKKAEEYLSGWKRERADFINYKKEESERAADVIEYATLALVLKILPILDTFEMGEKNLPDSLKGDEHMKGFLQIKSQIKEFLKDLGIEEMECLGQKFDPMFHEVAESVEAEGKESGTIIEEMRKGYKMNGKVIRPNRVKVVK